MRNRIAGKIELECGTYRPTGTQFMGGAYWPRPNAIWRELEKLRCDEPTARLVDAALARARREGPSVFPNHFSVRSRLIASGSQFCLGSAEPRFTDVDSAYIGAVYRRELTGQRPWVPLAMGSNWTLVALAALILEGDAGGLAAPAPSAGLQRFGIALVYGTPARSNLHGFAVDADSEIEFEADEFPKTLLSSTTTLARRILSEAERPAQMEEVA